MTTLNNYNVNPIGPNKGHLKPHVNRVARSRDKLIDSIEVLDNEARLTALYQIEKLAWKLLSGAFGAGAGMISSAVLKKIWGILFNGGTPPEGFSDPDANFTDVIGWTVITGVGVGVATIVAKRLAAIVWESATGYSADDYRKEKESTKFEKLKNLVL